MFRSFFPEPRLFFSSAVAWVILAMALWFLIGDQLAAVLSLGPILAIAPTELNPEPFFNAERVWLYQYVIMVGYGFCVPWYFYKRNRWYWWSVVTSVTILLIIYFQVQISAWLNDWYGRFFNLVQEALTNPGEFTIEEFYGEMFTVAFVLIPSITVAVILAFISAHYVFRWRRAMSFYYHHFWPHLRHIEGAAQRVQEDTMRFAAIMQGLGTSFVGSMITLVVFLPLLYGLSGQISEIPFIGDVDGGLVFVALLSASFGTVLLAVVGIKLPGLEFENQKVEAAIRKELVYGEDDPDRADPVSFREFFAAVQRNYFRLYWHYLYFNVARYAYLQGANFVPLIALGPSIVTGAITLGVYQQVSNAFDRVENSLQYLANSWTTIIELISVYKRLRAFESHIPDDLEEPDADVAVVPQ
ncbi:peptide antibiotic transporter SbmA [Pelagibacterium montanilacus]|uniref:peptide antibiotic transporter SbmA n=1 Tax=Pelagibacterium montanilacus TaxID=2185280 RepID=UPI000F8DD1CD|nr:peptide antibiotic transporter SbmA [Pelagibacterium montanilacus]